MLASFMKEQGEKLSLPVGQKTILGFIHWLAYKKKVKAGTINTYLAGVRNLHVVHGLEQPSIRSDIVKMILKGRQNIEAGKKLREKIGFNRDPVTPDILRLIKCRLAQWEVPEQDKLTIWAICTILFHGAFRGAELLVRHRNQFDPAFTLLRQDIVIVKDRSEEMVQIRIKAPKEDKKLTAQIEDIYQTKSDICPLKATKKWLASSKQFQPEQPAFRRSNGVPVSTSDLNKILKERLTGLLDQYRILAHSFRSGRASMMGSLGLADSEVKAIGRWSSRAFEDYLKLPRTKRALVAKEMSKFDCAN